MKKERIEQIVRDLPAKSHQDHDLAKWIRGYKLKNYLKRN